MRTTCSTRSLAHALIKTLLALCLVTLLITTRAVSAGNHVEHRHTVVVTVKGMGCPLCVYGVKERLLMLPGVKDVRVDLGRSQATIDLMEDAKVTNAQIAQAIHDAGFTPGEIK